MDHWIMSQNPPGTKRVNCWTHSWCGRDRTLQLAGRSTLSLLTERRARKTRASPLHLGAISSCNSIVNRNTPNKAALRGVERETCADALGQIDAHALWLRACGATSNRITERKLREDEHHAAAAAAAAAVVGPCVGGSSAVPPRIQR